MSTVKSNSLKVFNLFPNNEFPEYPDFELLWEGQWQDGALRLLRHPEDTAYIFHMFISEDLQFKGHIQLANINPNLTTETPMSELAVDVLEYLTQEFMKYQMQMKADYIKNGNAIQ